MIWCCRVESYFSNWSIMCRNESDRLSYIPHVPYGHSSVFSSSCHKVLLSWVSCKVTYCNLIWAEKSCFGWLLGPQIP